MTPRRADSPAGSCKTFVLSQAMVFPVLLSPPPEALATESHTAPLSENSFLVQREVFTRMDFCLLQLCH